MRGACIRWIRTFLLAVRWFSCCFVNAWRTAGDCVRLDCFQRLVFFVRCVQRLRHVWPLAFDNEHIQCLRQGCGRTTPAFNSRSVCRTLTLVFQNSPWWHISRNLPNGIGGNLHQGGVDIVFPRVSVESTTSGVQRLREWIGERYVSRCCAVLWRHEDWRDHRYAVHLQLSGWQRTWATELACRLTSVDCFLQ